MKPKLFFAALLLLSLGTFGQNKFTDLVVKMDKDLQLLSEKYPEETVAFFTDKQEYFSGDNILLSAFLTLNGKPSLLSKIVYVEVGDYTGSLVAKKMLSVEKGSAHAVIAALPDWPSGAYTINVYSLWMKNTPHLIAQKQIFLVAKDYLQKPFVFQKRGTPISAVRFQPEGKCWVANNPQNFVLHLVDKNGLPLSKTFAIVENGKEIFSAQTDANGLCKLQLTLKSGLSYQLKTSDGQLPLILPANEGIGLSFTTENKTRLFVTLQKSPSTKSNQFLLVGFDKEKVCFQSVFDFAEGGTATAITKAKLPKGLIHFLLFDEALQVVAQRDYLNFLPATLAAEEKNGIKLMLKIDSLSNGTIAVSVPPQQTLFGTTGDVLSLLPEVQYRSAILLPDFSPASLQTLDVLLWLQPAAYLGKTWSVTEPVLKFPVESGITLRGNIKPFAGSRNPTGYKAEIIIKGEDSTTAFSSVQTQPNGDFVIGDLAFQQGARIFFQGNNRAKNKELLDMQLYPSYFDTLSKLTLMPAVRYEKQYTGEAAGKDLQNYFAELDSNSQYRSLAMVVVKAKARSPFDSLKQAYLSPLFADGNATILKPEGHFINFWHFLRGRVPGLQVEGSLDNPTVSFSRYGGTLNPTNNSGEDLSESFGEAAGILFFLNEVQVSKDVVGTLNPDDIALVSINKEPMPALGAYNGAIAIFTKKGASLGNTTAKSMAVEKRLGYSNFVSVYKLDETAYKPGTTVLFGAVKKPVQISLPATRSLKIIAVGWNKNDDFVFDVQ